MSHCLQHNSAQSHTAPSSIRTLLIRMSYCHQRNSAQSHTAPSSISTLLIWMSHCHQHNSAQSHIAPSSIRTLLIWMSHCHQHNSAQSHAAPSSIRTLLIWMSHCLQHNTHSAQLGLYKLRPTRPAKLAAWGPTTVLNHTLCLCSANWKILPINKTTGNLSFLNSYICDVPGWCMRLWRYDFMAL